MADYIVRGVDCGAMTSLEASDATGLSIDELTAMARPADEAVTGALTSGSERRSVSGDR
jgi:hypothetical protein